MSRACSWDVATDPQIRDNNLAPRRLSEGFRDTCAAVAASASHGEGKIADPVYGGLGMVFSMEGLGTVFSMEC
jgi:hypothetical protein